MLYGHRYEIICNLTSLMYSLKHVAYFVLCAMWLHLANEWLRTCAGKVLALVIAQSFGSQVMSIDRERTAPAHTVQSPTPRTACAPSADLSYVQHVYFKQPWSLPITEKCCIKTPNLLSCTTHVKHTINSSMLPLIESKFINYTFSWTLTAGLASIWRPLFPPSPNQFKHYYLYWVI